MMVFLEKRQWAFIRTGAFIRISTLFGNRSQFCNRYFHFQLWAALDV